MRKIAADKNYRLFKTANPAKGSVVAMLYKARIQMDRIVEDVVHGSNIKAITNITEDEKKVLLRGLYTINNLFNRATEF